MFLKELLQKLALEKGPHFFPEDWDTCLRDFIPHALQPSPSLQDTLGITAEQMELFYAEAYRFYLHHQLEDADFCFRFLVLFDPWVKKYWMGLAACQQRSNKYEKALHSYAITTLLSPDDPYPHFYAYQCYEALQQKEDARKALTLAYERVQCPSYKALKKKIESLHCFSSICKT